MTAFVTQRRKRHWVISPEVRSVNHRYREVSLRLPEELRFAETAFRDLIAGALARGRVDATLRFHSALASEADPAIDNE